MALASKHGQMEPDMRDFGGTIKHVDVVNFGMWMATYLKGNGLTIRLTATESMYI